VGEPDEGPFDAHPRGEPLPDIQGEVEPLDPREQRQNLRDRFDGGEGDPLQVTADAGGIEPQDLQADLAGAARAQAEGVE
jgi:hypothetical protein